MGQASLAKSPPSAVLIGPARPSSRVRLSVALAKRSTLREVCRTATVVRCHVLIIGEEEQASPRVVNRAFRGTKVTTRLQMDGRRPIDLVILKS
jgi:hypothetical protein